MQTSCEKNLVESSRMDRRDGITSANPFGSKLPEQHEGLTCTAYPW